MLLIHWDPCCACMTEVMARLAQMTDPVGKEDHN